MMLRAPCAVIVCLVGLLEIAGCKGGSEAPLPAPAPAAAPGPVAPAADPAAQVAPAAPADASRPFKVEVVLDDRARTEIVKRREEIEVDVTFLDPSTGGENLAQRSQRFLVGSEGGTVEVGAFDLSPTKPGGNRLSEMNISVYSARKSSQDNLLNCSFAGGAVVALQASYRVSCTLL